MLVTVCSKLITHIQDFYSFTSSLPCWCHEVQTSDCAVKNVLWLSFLYHSLKPGGMGKKIYAQSWKCIIFVWIFFSSASFERTCLCVCMFQSSSFCIELITKSVVGGFCSGCSSLSTSLHTWGRVCLLTFLLARSFSSSVWNRASFRPRSHGWKIHWQLWQRTLSCNK